MNLGKRLEQLADQEAKERNIYRNGDSMARMIKGKAYAWIDKNFINGMDRMMTKRAYDNYVNSLDVLVGR